MRFQFSIFSNQAIAIIVSYGVKKCGENNIMIY
jgi:hypothetical protein